ncbi:hypothetical protein [Nitrosophilus labii]|uniref:hypothetical protein n=1 Tax=Nitrosophilus labii TaxID=2706014 RepID=UPI001656B8D7|nr:hypothetical protein [Nitrosophilus labii]
MNIFFTFDYELFFGRKSGTALKSIIEPTNELIKIADVYGVKYIFFVDSGYLLRLQEYKKKYSYIKKEYDLVFSQLEELSKKGHEIQLHIHSHWEDSFYDGKKWVFDLKRYRLHSFTKYEIEDIVKRYKKVLENFSDNIFAYRAGGWCIQPFKKIKEALKKNNIWLDSTIYYGGNNLSKTHYFDFRNAPKKTLWKFEDDPLIEQPNGTFTEIPIGYIKIYPQFFWKLIIAKKVKSTTHKVFGDGNPIGFSKKDILKLLAFPSYNVVSCDGYRSILLEKAYELYEKNKNYNNLVIIGHPKAQSRFSIRKIDEFVKIHKNIITFENYFVI